MINKPSLLPARGILGMSRLYHSEFTEPQTFGADSALTVRAVKFKFVGALAYRAAQRRSTKWIVTS
jgi:hypothetical protein